MAERSTRRTSANYAAGSACWHHCVAKHERDPGPAEIQRRAWEEWGRGHPLAPLIARMMARARERDDAAA